VAWHLAEREWIAGLSSRRKLQNFTARSYRFAAALCVFHLIQGLPKVTPDPLI
jgi:hypothetical protein